MENRDELECNAAKSSTKVFPAISGHVSRESSLFIDFERKDGKCKMQIVVARTRGKARGTLGSSLDSKVSRTLTPFPGSGNHRAEILRAFLLSSYRFFVSAFSASNKRVAEPTADELTVQFVYYY